MRRVATRKGRILASPHWQSRQRVAILLIVGCLPSLLFNVGTGRSVLIHKHSEQSFHTHVISGSEHRHHVHPHEARHGHDYNEADESDHHDPLSQPTEPHTDTVIRGTEVAVLTKHEAATNGVALPHSLPVPLLISAAAALPVASPPLRRSLDGSRGAGWTERACLRAVILLI